MEGREEQRKENFGFPMLQERPAGAAAAVPRHRMDPGREQLEQHFSLIPLEGGCRLDKPGLGWSSARLARAQRERSINLSPNEGGGAARPASWYRTKYSARGWMQEFSLSASSPESGDTLSVNNREIERDSFKKKNLFLVA